MTRVVRIGVAVVTTSLLPYASHPPPAPPLAAATTRRRSRAEVLERPSHPVPAPPTTACHAIAVRVLRPVLGGLHHARELHQQEKLPLVAAGGRRGGPAVVPRSLLVTTAAAAAALSAVAAAAPEVRPDEELSLPFRGIWEHPLCASWFFMFLKQGGRWVVGVKDSRVCQRISNCLLIASSFLRGCYRTRF